MDSEISKDVGLYIAYGAMVTMAAIPIYLGSKGSIKSMKRPANAPKPKKSESPLDDSDDEDDTATESLSSSDAYMFPVIGSGVLFSLFMVFKYIDKKYVDYVLTAYFSLMGCAAVTKASLDIFKSIVPVSWLSGVAKYKVTLSKRSKYVSHFNLTVIHFALLASSLVLTVFYGLSKHWVASNIFGFSFSVNAIQLLSLDSFKTGMILLSGLFFYDIFWVFYTPVMVSVAKNFDAPIKLLWPRNIVEHLFDKATSFTMLGLGDIVIPGIFVALALRYDRHISWQRRPVGQFRSLDFPKPYFHACFTAYILGLITTTTVMHLFKAAQPALLYLSPACILSVLITAFSRGELQELWAYKVEETDKKETDKKETEKEREEKRPLLDDGQTRKHESQIIEEIIEEEDGQIQLEEIELEED
ncbi:signal peptide peptidase-domain-containing protein [Sporodiniella umbellata]|nr:signal peptide peptidase-domain-containing protein [Sporodiniella umbellata]